MTILSRISSSHPASAPHIVEEGQEHYALGRTARNKRNIDQT
jgi:hypothetical protein